MPTVTVAENVVGVSGPVIHVVEIGIAGPQGPAGPPGSGGSDSYRHVQGSASAVWTVAHALNMYPNITVIDSAGRVVEGEIAYPDANTVVLTFSAAFSGEAYAS